MGQSYTRQARGRAIADTPGQVRRAGDKYTVLSQTMPNTKYTLARTSRGWDCSCPDTVPYCKHAHAVECRLGPKARADRGLLIHEMGGQVERLAPDHCLVKSQSSDRTYEVRDFGHGWMCSCPDHLHTGAHCKHIQAVEFQDNTRTVIEPHDDATCKFCDSPHIIKKGRRGRSSSGAARRAAGGSSRTWALRGSTPRRSTSARRLKCYTVACPPARRRPRSGAWA